MSYDDLPGTGDFERYWASFGLNKSQAPFTLERDPAAERWPELAAYLTQPAIETEINSSGEPWAQHKVIEDKHYLARHVSDVTKALEDSLAKLAEQLRGDRNVLPELDQDIAKALDGDWQTLERWGLRSDLSWLTDVTWSMVKNRPVEIQATPTRRSSVSVSGWSRNYFMDYSNCGPNGIACNILRMIGSLPLGYTRPVFPVDDRVYSNDFFTVTDQDRNGVVAAVVSETRRIPGLTPNAKPGKDFVMFRESEMATGIDKLADRLHQTKCGVLVPYKDGRLWFQPYPWVDAASRAALPDNGVLLRDIGGMPTAVARSGTSFLSPVNKSFSHIILHDQSHPEDSSMVESRALLRALGITTDYHISYNSRGSGPRYTAIPYIIGRCMKSALTDIASSLRVFDATSAMDPEVYLRHNYANPEGIWPEDKQGIEALTAILPALLKPKSISKAAIIGYGPFSWPALAVAPFMKESGQLDISDILEKNVAFTRKWLDGRATSEHAAVYTQFANLFRHANPELYKSCEQEMRNTATLRVAALEDLNTDSVEVLLESFVTCSKDVEKYRFRASLREKARILKWEPTSVMVSVHMVESEGWSNNGDEDSVRIEATRLSLEDIERDYRELGMEVYLVPLQSDAQLREGYKGMVLVIARPLSATKPSPTVIR